jgi:hypothetical protein
MGINHSLRYEIIHTGLIYEDVTVDQAYYAQVVEGNLEAHAVGVSLFSSQIPSLIAMAFTPSSPPIPKEEDTEGLNILESFKIFIEESTTQTISDKGGIWVVKEACYGQKIGTELAQRAFEGSIDYQDYLERGFPATPERSDECIILRQWLE